MNLSQCYQALHKMYNVGPQTVKKLLEYDIDLISLFNMPYKALIDIGIPINLSKQIVNFDLNTLQKDAIWGEEHNHHILTWDSELYPNLLKQIADPPLVIYAIGDLSCLSFPMVAIVGSRDASAIGLEIAQEFSYDLARQNLVIVSGLAYGVDATAHAACIKAHGRTIAVMGTGVDVIYPQKHKNLSTQIINNGLILSEFPLGTTPQARHFPRRNRIISGLSLATLVIEATLKSGSLITAKFALEQNREVLAVPGSIHNAKAQGCHELIKQGALLVTSPKEVLAALNLDIMTDTNNISSINNSTNRLLNYIDFHITSVDKIIKRSGLLLDDVLCELADLELSGYIKSISGGYIRCKI